MTTQFEQLASMYALFFEQPATGSASVEEDPVAASTRLVREVEEHLRHLCDSLPTLEQQHARIAELLEKRLSSRTAQRLQACNETLTILREAFDRLGAEALREVAQIATCARETLSGSQDNSEIATLA
ncbi:MAG: hypothetical protein ACYCW6_25860 [Candidatus Xenobia bacterium]